MDYNLGIPGQRLVNTAMPAFGSRRCPSFDLAGKGSVPMKKIFDLNPVFAAVLLVSSLVWGNSSFAQATSNNASNQPAAAPSTTVPAGSQSIPVNQPASTAQVPSTPASSQPAPASQPVPAATQPASSDSQQQPADADTQANKDAQTNKKDTFKHDGGKDDVDAIGNRKGVGGRGLGNWYSYKKEIAMGKEYAQQIEASVKLINDPVITEYVNRVGQNLVRNSDAKVPFTIKVIDSDEINAMALPGGFFYVNSGLVLAADNEAELAGVMGHEIAHVCARHATRQMTRSQWANFATLPLIFVGGAAGYAARL